VNIGVHLPLLDFGSHPFTRDHLTGYVSAAARLGFTTLAANDHMVFSVPWLDGPTALAAVAGDSQHMRLATTVALPVIRGPVPLAKTLGAIDRLSGGKLTVGVGPGSSQLDYDAVGLDFSERWGRLDEAIQAMRALWRADGEPFVGRYYSTKGLQLDPPPIQPDGPPIWIGSWGSRAGLRRVARLGDGWLASAYNTTPALLAEAWSSLRELLAAHDKDAETFPNAVATMFCYVTDNRAEADLVMRQRIAPRISRPEELLRDRLPVGPAEVFAEKLTDYERAGVQSVYIWPVADEVKQLEVFAETVRPLLAR
jgi:alkanesulfonate monooxygenase SsuD/methylene tetrahydromethanopterin reductase-like flavin-dependent oxidoreductase (luciferase family)